MGASYEYYRIFYYVSKYRNFTKAANYLLTSQPAITRSIQNLENELGCQLFVRNKRGVELTHEGQLLFEYVSAGCEQFIRGEAKITGALSMQNGIIYLGVNETSFSDYMLQILEKFHFKYPYVKLKILNLSTIHALDELLNETIDIAIVKTPTDVMRPLKETKLKTFQDIMVCGKAYESLAEKKVHLKDLSNYPLVCASKGTKTYDFLESYYRNHNLILMPDFEANTFDMLLHLVQKNFGLGFIPEKIAQEALERGDIFKVNLLDKVPTRSICMVLNPEHPQTKLIKELQRMIVNGGKADSESNLIN